jgi:NDP-sugar pyrophosphorylase family protein
MNAVLICPSSRKAVEHLALSEPLAAIPLLGESLLEYWLAHLALTGIKEVWILASDRPEQISALACDGARWGLHVHVIAEARESTPDEARTKYAGEFAAPGTCEVIVLDHFPGLSQPIFASYADMITGLFEWLPRAKMPDRVGMHEVQPGIWIGLHTRISQGARLHSPCWIGQTVYVGAVAVVGPMAIIEDHAFIEPDADIAGSVIGANTFVGRSTMIHDSFALGSMLINWKSEVCTQVTDAFVLSALRTPTKGRLTDTLLARLGEFYSRHKDDPQMLWKHFLPDHKS